jgi:hypothetical protein
MNAHLQLLHVFFFIKPAKEKNIERYGQSTTIKYVLVHFSSKYETLTSEGGLGRTGANPCLLHSHAAAKLPNLHDAGTTTPPRAILELTHLSPHTYSIHEQAIDDIGTSGSCWSIRFFVHFPCSNVHIIKNKNKDERKNLETVIFSLPSKLCII